MDEITKLIGDFFNYLFEDILPLVFKLLKFALLSVFFLPAFLIITYTHPKWKDTFKELFGN